MTKITICITCYHPEIMVGNLVTVPVTSLLYVTVAISHDI